MTCGEIRDSIPLFLYGELSFDEEEKFENHIDACAECRRELASERRIHFAFDAVEEPVTSDQLLQARREFAGQPAVTAARGGSFWNRLQHLAPFRWHVPTAAQPVGALALIAMGFFGARMIPPTLPGLNTAGLAAPIASRVRYVEPEPSGKVQIVLEETRERTLRGNLNDDTIQRLLLTAAKDPENPGLRVDSVDLLRSSPASSEVRDALLQALLHDSNAGVRLKALDGLKSSASDPEVRKVLSRVLLADKNPGVRTQVIDLLIQQKEQPQMVGRTAGVDAERRQRVRPDALPKSAPRYEGIGGDILNR